MAEPKSARSQVTIGTTPVPAPPTPTLPAPWSARLAGYEGCDLDLVHRWMNEPHVALYWDQAWSRERWSEHLANQLAGVESRPFLIDHEGRPVAYVELYRAAHHAIAAHYDADPHDLGVHIAIGELGLTGRGFGHAICRSLIEAILFEEPACRRIIAEPDVRNNAARRLFLTLGMHLVGEVDLGYKRAVLFMYGRDTADVPR